MTISEKARAKPPVAEMPENERPISERFRVAAWEWVQAEKAASLLEETKTATLSQMMLKLNEKTVSAAEMKVKGSDEWTEFLYQMVDARSQANLKKVAMEYIRMQFSEWQSHDANARRERQMGRHGT